MKIFKTKKEGFMSTDSNKPPIFIVAGEVSGDLFAAELMSHINQICPSEFIGCGGTHMEKQGLIPIGEDNSLFSSIGLLESVGFLHKHVKLLRSIIPNIKKYQCEHVILVDHEVFNIIVAKKIRKHFGKTVKIHFFIPPRVSMWGAKSAPTIAGLCDDLFCYMESDLPIYQQYNKNSFFFGNPLSQKLKTFLPNPHFFQEHRLDPHRNYIALMPGSRKQEIKTLLPVFLKAALQLNIERNIEFLMTVAHEGLSHLIQEEITKVGAEHFVHIIKDSSLEIMSHCPLGFVSAGTITLESVMMGMYPIITYKVSNFTFKTIKKSENLGDETLIGLPNVFLQQRLFPEILQFEVTSKRLYEEAIYFLDLNSDIKSYFMKSTRSQISDILGSTDSIKKVAEYITEGIKNG